MATNLVRAKNKYKSNMKDCGESVFFQFQSFIINYDCPHSYFRQAKKGVTFWASVTIWVIVTFWVMEGFHVEGIDSSIRIGLFDDN